MEIYHAFNKLFISRSWFSPAILYLTFFCIFWDGFMIVWFSIAFANEQYGMALFGSIHGLVGIGLTYSTIAGYVNKTYITVRKIDTSTLRMLASVSSTLNRFYLFMAAGGIEARCAPWQRTTRTGAAQHGNRTLCPRTLLCPP
jgi:hypothetical protein